MTSETSIIDASFGLLERLIAIAADPEAARRHIAEVKAACEAARAEAEAAQAKAEAARAEAEAARARLAKERAALETERAELKQRSLAFRESERSLRVLQDTAARAREKERERYIGPAFAANPAGFAPAGSIAARARADYADAPSYVGGSELAQGPPSVPRQGSGKHYPQKRSEV
jgi:hypothetical protein